MKKLRAAANQFLTRKQTRISVMSLAGLLAFSALVFANVNGGGRSSSSSSSLSPGQAQNTLTGQWTAEMDRDKPGEIRLSYHRSSESGGFSMTGGKVALGELQGLTADAVFSA